MIHRYWQGPPPAADYGPALHELTGLDVHDWTDEQLPAWLDGLATATAPFVTGDRQVQHRANVVRAGLLWDHGGMWADHDLEPLADLTRLPDRATAAHADRSRCSCWLAYPAGHPDVGLVLDAIAAIGPPVRRAVEQSGEQLWGRLLDPSVPAVQLHAGWAVHHAWTSARGLASRHDRHRRHPSPAAPRTRRGGRRPHRAARPPRAPRRAGSPAGGPPVRAIGSGSTLLIERAEWGARPPDGAYGGLNPTEGVTGHWEGGGIGWPWPHETCYSLVRGIQAFHMDGRGWIDIAYNGLACPHGYVFEGRGPSHKSAGHGEPGNSVSYALCFLSGVGDEFTPEQHQAWADGRRWLQDEGGASDVLHCHLDWMATACPGDERCEWVHAGANPGAPIVVPPEPPPDWQPALPAPGIDAPPFPLPDGSYFGPEGGPNESVSGYHGHSDDLATWQARMIERGWNLGPTGADGTYGKPGDTEPSRSWTGRVAAGFQQDKGLAVDGLIGPDTWGAAWTAPIT